MGINVESVRKFLADAGFDIEERVTGAFSLIAQNPAMIVFVCDVSGSLRDSLRSAIRQLTQPFRSKSFGTKTMELYVVFVSKNSLPLEEIEKCERDMRVFRKIVLGPDDHLASRLASLRPIEDMESLTTDLESIFWQELGRSLKPGEIAILEEMSKGKAITPESLAERLREAQ